eukprot:bmy_09066T0
MHAASTRHTRAETNPHGTLPRRSEDGPLQTPLLPLPPHLQVQLLLLGKLFPRSTGFPPSPKGTGGGVREEGARGRPTLPRRPPPPGPGRAGLTPKPRELAEDHFVPFHHNLLLLNVVLSQDAEHVRHLRPPRCRPPRAPPPPRPPPSSPVASTPASAAAAASQLQPHWQRSAPTTAAEERATQAAEDPALAGKAPPRAARGERLISRRQGPRRRRPPPGGAAPARETPLPDSHSARSRIPYRKLGARGRRAHVRRTYREHCPAHARGARNSSSPPRPARRVRGRRQVRAHLRGGSGTSIPRARTGCSTTHLECGQWFSGLSFSQDGVWREICRTGITFPTRSDPPSKWPTTKQADRPQGEKKNVRRLEKDFTKERFKSDQITEGSVETLFRGKGNKTQREGFQQNVEAQLNIILPPHSRHDGLNQEKMQEISAVQTRKLQVPSAALSGSPGPAPSTTS